ncbi:Polynucleotide 5'-hydroxyl-kinase GRC3 [Grifola frondosa]|uniref:Polynucleotide 5'-hydroxyl-kinase GRC3 n=1 Tax=Grifola frondosa TaxID=5627 RepID=A0A1C7LUN8_GRIFR|nr:Polynucleotide 5'-hydroxyl-kinase GRC3 [Grifola frondosa]
MLSAVAARKARLGGKKPQPEVVSAPQKHTPSPSPSPEIVPVTKPPSKRKSSATAFNASKKKKKQHKPAERKRARYFQEDAFKTQDDVIMVDEDDEDESDASQSSMSVDRDALERVPSQTTTRSDHRTRQKRAWSPSAPLDDSSDEEGEDAVEDDSTVFDNVAPILPARTVPQEPSLLSSFLPALNDNTFYVTADEVKALNLLSSCSEQKGTVLVLSALETVALLGTYLLTVLDGSVSLCGITLPASRMSYRIFSPRSSPLPVIQCLSTNASPHGLHQLPGRISNAVEGSAAVILLQELRTDVEGLGQVCRTFDGIFMPSRWQRSHPAPELGLEGVHFLTHQTHDVSPMIIPPSWDSAMSAILQVVSEHQDFNYPRRVYLVRGSRNSGKSTFARTLLNRLISRYRRVAFLECDLGQSEFTLGGMVTLNIVDQPLFGPPFTHPSIPHTAHFIGATSPRSSPSHYLESIQALVQTYNLDIQNADLAEDLEGGDDRIADVIPLVVNTMGWTKGLGAELARKIEEMVEPSDIFELDAPATDEGWATSRAPVNQDHSTVHKLESISSSVLSTHYSAADHRNLSILSYFHAAFPAAVPTSSLTSVLAMSWNTSLPLCCQPPYEVDWKVAFDKVLLTGAGMEDVVPSEIHAVLNCAIVGLVACEPGALDADADNTTHDALSTLPYKQAASPPSPLSSKCHGLALIRALSPPATSSLMHLLTPLPPYLFASSRVLCKGELELPVWGMLDFRTLDSGGDVAGVERGKVPYLRWGKGEGAGGERRRVRRNLMRRGQM